MSLIHVPRIIERRVAYDTPWFRIVAKKVLGLVGGEDALPYYALEAGDYVSVVALTPREEFILVRQFRPVLERMTLELPSGTVDKGEEPAQSARREFMEESGYRADRWDFLGCLAPDTGRLGNRMWCYLAREASADTSGWSPEPGIEPVLCGRSELLGHILEGQFEHALNLAALCIAEMKIGIGLFHR